jgi:predicted alpha/beta hydrolase family esterase
VKNAIILHGCPEKEAYYDPKLPSESNAHWLPWLQKELLIRDIAAVTPEIPLAYEPKWELWCREVERFNIGPETILVGHSAGGGFWLKYLSQHPELRTGKVVLVAPWLDPGKTLDENFYEGDFDPQLVSRTDGIVIFRSDDDSDSVHQSIKRITEEIDGVELREFTGKGHFTYDNLSGVKFPELLQELVGPADA